MKKRNILRASGALLIFAVLGLLSACKNFFTYEPEGARFSSELVTISMHKSEPPKKVNITVFKSSKKINDIYVVTWEFDRSGVAKVIVSPEDGDDLPETDFSYSIKRKTNLIFTVSAIEIDAVPVTLSILIYDSDPSDPDASILDMCEVIITVEP